jgi:PAS domain S-box-containing protein
MQEGERFEASLTDEGLHRLLIEAVTDYAIYMLDPAGIVTSWNPGAQRFKGYRADEIVGQHFSRFYTEEDRASGQPQRALETAVLAGRFEEEGSRVRKDGTRFWASVVVDPIRGPAGEIVGFAKITRDITAAHDSRIALERTREALFQSQKMEAVGQLTGGLAHDFNNMLTGIIGSIELMQTRVAQGRYNELERYLGAAQSAAKRAAALTHRLLAFSRQQTLSPKATDVNRLVGGMEDLVRRTVGPSVTVETVGAGGLWTTMIDFNQLENALLNLCLNARDAMPNGGRLTIETANRWLDEHGAGERGLEPGQYVTLCVSDTGTGMSAEVVRRAFDPFFTTKPIGEGTGLGLSMIQGFLRQSDGQVRIYSEVGTGTMICLYLPRHHGDAERDAARSKPDGADRNADGLTVLVVDDEPTVRMLATEVLEEAGYFVIEAGDGADGLAVMQSDARVDLLITDIGLPGGMNGRQLAEACRLLRPTLKVLFITGYAENAVTGHGILEPGMHLLTKPFVLADLTRRVDAIIAGP